MKRVRLLALVVWTAGIGFTTVADRQTPARFLPADRAVARTDENSEMAHAQLLDKARRGGISMSMTGWRTERAGCTTA
jgi:hypothetical protein